MNVQDLLPQHLLVKNLLRIESVQEFVTAASHLSISRWIEVWEAEPPCMHSQAEPGNERNNKGAACGAPTHGFAMHRTRHDSRVFPGCATVSFTRVTIWTIAHR
jgi:hypothetical protein